MRNGNQEKGKENGEQIILRYWLLCCFTYIYTTNYMEQQSHFEAREQHKNVITVTENLQPTSAGGKREGRKKG